VTAALRRLAARDAAIAAATLVVWALDARLRADGGPAVAAGIAAVAAGVLTALCGFLLHEWGHLLGALSSGAVVHPAPRAASVFLFRFDVSRSTRAQFLRMSWGGFAASAVAVALLLAVLPLDALSGQVALGLVALGVIATFVLEIPVAWRVARGGPLPTGAAYASAASATAATASVDGGARGPS
jgi:hypothetical protein